MKCPAWCRVPACYICEMATAARPSQKISVIALSALAALWGISAFGAASSDCADTYFLSIKLPSKCESQHNLPLGAGIASPSVNTTPFENPAGYIFNSQVKVHASYSRLSDGTPAPERVSALAVTGNGFLGGGIAYHSYKYYPTGSFAPTANVPSAKQIGFAFANAIDPANLAAGFSFFRSMESNTMFSAIRGGGSNPINFGTLLNPKGKFKFGFTAFDILSGTAAAGTGVATNFSERTAAALDILGSVTKKSYIVKGTLGTSISIVQLTLGYGVSVGGERVIAWVPNGLSLGAGAWFAGDKVRLIMSINQIDAFYLGATVALGN